MRKSFMRRCGCCWRSSRRHRWRIGAELSRPSIKVVVPYPAGGPTDTIARAVTHSLSGALGQSVIIENQSGAGGRIAMKQVANAAPDGYTLLMGGTNNNAITPAVYKDLDFDAMKDFAPVAPSPSTCLASWCIVVR